MVVEEAATWRAARAGGTTGEARGVATVSGLDGGLVAGVFRHDGLEDEIRPEGAEGR